jgi:hypothetical protein
MVRKAINAAAHAYPQNAGNRDREREREQEK